VSAWLRRGSTIVERHVSSGMSHGPHGRLRRGGGGLKAPTPPVIHKKLVLPGRARFGRTDSRFYVPGNDGAAANCRPAEPTLTYPTPNGTPRPRAPSCRHIKFFQFLSHIGTTFLLPLVRRGLDFFAHLVQRLLEHVTELQRHVLHFLFEICNLRVF